MNNRQLVERGTDDLARFIQNLHGDLIDRVFEEILDDPVFHAAYGLAGLEHCQRGVINLGSHLPERFDVVQNPKGPSVRAQNHVMVRYHQVANRSVG